jgi:hypothetical protein
VRVGGRHWTVLEAVASNTDAVDFRSEHSAFATVTIGDRGRYWWLVEPYGAYGFSRKHPGVRKVGVRTTMQAAIAAANRELNVRASRGKTP